MERMISAGGRLEVLSGEPLRLRLREAGIEEDRPASSLRGSDESRYVGRGRPTVLHLPGVEPIVVKSLHHGGVLAFLQRDWFLGAGRLLRAVALLQHLERSGVAAPRVAFARIRRARGLRFLCRLELATFEVPDSLDLRGFLESQPPAPAREAVAVAVGRALRALHDCGVQHADLNAKNLLVQGGPDATVWIVDVEGSRRRAAPLPVSGVVRNLERLLRSLIKTGLWGGVVGPRWAALVLRSYDPDRWRDLWRRTRRAYQLTAPCHRLAWSLQASRSRASRPGSGWSTPGNA